MSRDWGVYRSVRHQQGRTSIMSILTMIIYVTVYQCIKYNSAKNAGG